MLFYGQRIHPTYTFNIYFPWSLYTITLLCLFYDHRIHSTYTYIIIHVQCTLDIYFPCFIYIYIYIYIGIITLVSHTCIVKEIIKFRELCQLIITTFKVVTTVTIVTTAKIGTYM